MNLHEPLNQAHRLERTADRLLRGNQTCESRFSAAIKCLSQAADLYQALAQKLLESRGQTISSADASHQLLIQTLRLQQQNCLRQVKELKNRSAFMTEESSKLDSDLLKEAILHKVEQQDSLLARLGWEEPLSKAENGVKVPKNELEVMEELKFCNSELRKLVERLVAELEAKCRENRELRAQLGQQVEDKQPILDFEPLHLPEFSPLSDSNN